MRSGSGRGAKSWRIGGLAGWRAGGSSRRSSKVLDVDKDASSGSSWAPHCATYGRWLESSLGGFGGGVFFSACLARPGGEGTAREA